MHWKNFIELHFIKDILPGYFWIFPLPGNQVNVGIGIRSDVVSKRKINLRDKFNDIVHTHPAISERFKHAKALEEPRGWGLPLGSKLRTLSGDNFLLTGDAASLIDPFTGEGIGNAMLSGMIAARSAREAMAQERYDENFLRQYRQEVYRKLGPELKLSHTLQKLSEHAWLFNFVVRKAVKNKALQETITSMFDDTGARSKLKSPLFYFQMMFN
jgi:flavin-dependent dehydrogenase